MIIDVNNPATFPTEIENLVFNYIDEMPSDAISQLNNIENGVTDGSPKYYFDKIGAPSLYDSILPLFKGCSLRCYHATRVLDEKTILNNGLLLNDWNNYSVILREALELTAIPETDIENAITLAKKEQERKTQDIPPVICFYSSSFMDCIPETFCCNVGGEIARWALEDKMPDVFEKLKNIGTPVVVECALPLDDIEWPWIEEIVYFIVYFYAEKKLWNRNYTIKFEGRIKRNIKPSEIVRIIPNK